MDGVAYSGSAQSNPEHSDAVAHDGLPYVMTVERAAREASLGQSTVRKAIREGELKATRHGVVVRILREDFLAWVRSWADAEGTAL
jgi:excisionase family DNA binding protein